MLHLLRPLAKAGNILCILWILFNGIDEGFRGTKPEIISYICLMLLLALNSFLLIRYRKK
ncbi:MAG: hypothetical protein R2794_10520 [Chitinophagales bacterium]